MPLPARLQPCSPASEAIFDPALTRAELVAVVTTVVDGELSDAEQDYVLRFLEVNLPGAQIGLLLEWPGEWFKNRWFEEAELPPEEVVEYALSRCEREFLDQQALD